MALPSNTGYLDELANQVFPNNTGTWADLTTWAEWTTWITEPVTPMVYVSTPVDLGQERSFTLKILTDATGTVDYDIYISDTGEFAGEETLTSITNGETGISSFTGRYYAVAVKVNNTTGNVVLNGFEMIVSDATVAMDLNSVDTSTLAGSNTARQLVLPREVSQIVDMQIQPHAVTGYQLDVYVTDYPTCTTVIPRIVSKGATPTIALVGLDNIPRDGVVDVQIRALPEQYMSGNNLLVR